MEHHISLGSRVKQIRRINPKQPKLIRSQIEIKPVTWARWTCSAQADKISANMWSAGTPSKGATSACTSASQGTFTQNVLRRSPRILTSSRSFPSTRSPTAWPRASFWSSGTGIGSAQLTKKVQFRKASAAATCQSAAREPPRWWPWPPFKF